MKYDRTAVDRIMTARGLTSPQVAKRSRGAVKERNVRFIRRGLVIPSAETIAALCRALRVEPSEFFTNGRRKR